MPKMHPKESSVVGAALPRAVMLLGVALLLAFLIAPLYAPDNALLIVRLITGFYAALFILVGMAGILPWARWYGPDKRTQP
jgi:hypothetical protein